MVNGETAKSPTKRKLSQVLNCILKLIKLNFWSFGLIVPWNVMSVTASFMWFCSKMKHVSDVNLKTTTTGTQFPRCFWRRRRQALCLYSLFIVFKFVFGILISVGRNLPLTFYSLWMDDSSINRIKPSARLFVLVYDTFLMIKQKQMQNLMQQHSKSMNPPQKQLKRGLTC